MQIMDAIILNQKVRYFFWRETVGEFPTAHAIKNKLYKSPVENTYIRSTKGGWKKKKEHQVIVSSHCTKGLVSWPNSDLRVQPCRAKMDEGQRWHPKAIWNMQGKTEGTEKNFTKRPWRGLRPTYSLWWHDRKTCISWMCHTISSKCHINHLI